jgi:hypothetical protein
MTMKTVLTLDFFNHEPSEQTRDDELQRIAAMVADGYTSGDISLEFDPDDNPDEPALGVRGWWSLTAED